MASNTYNLNTYKAIFLAKEPTLTIGATGKTFDGTVDVSFSKDEILGTSDSTYFLRGDKTWTNILTRANHTADIGIIVENTDTTNPLKVGYIVGTSGNGGIFDYTHSVWKVQIAPDGTTTFIGSLDGNATTASYPLGFSSRSTSVSWGDQTGSTVTAWNESDGGSIEFRKNNPSSGKLSVKVDGRFYVAEGLVPVGGLKTDGSYWGLTSPDGDDTVWIRTTTQGILPNSSGGIGSGHSWIGHSSWFFGSAFVDHVYSHTLDLAGATDNNMSSTTSNPGIVFSEGASRTQPVFLVYTDYDSYRSPAGLKIFGGDSNASPAWFEVEGQIYAAGGTMTGAFNFANNVNNKMGDDAYIGDQNVAGHVVISGINGASGLRLAAYSTNLAASIIANRTDGLTVRTESGNSWLYVGRDDASAVKGVYFPGYGGGIYMQDTTYLRIYNNKRVYNASTDRYAFYTEGGFASGGQISEVFNIQYNGTWYGVLYNHKNGNLSLDGPGGSLYLSYYRGNTYFAGGTYYINRSGHFNGSCAKCSNIISVKVNLTFTNGRAVYSNSAITASSRIFVIGCNDGSTGMIFSTGVPWAGNVEIHGCDYYNGTKLSWNGTKNNIKILIDNS